MNELKNVSSIFQPAFSFLTTIQLLVSHKHFSAETLIFTHCCCFSCTQWENTSDISTCIVELFFKTPCLKCDTHPWCVCLLLNSAGVICGAQTGNSLFTLRDEQGNVVFQLIVQVSCHEV